MSIRDLTRWAAEELASGSEMPDIARSHKALRAASELHELFGSRSRTPVPPQNSQGSPAPGAAGPPPRAPRRPRPRMCIERSQANIPAMQQQLYVPPDAEWDADQAFTVIYTPTMATPEYPDDLVIAIDLDNWVTRVAGADYFGESKMGSLRMWNEWVYQRGGLAMHSGAKVIPTRDGDRVALIVGLSGTGKTTTTFTRQNESLPVQDDFVALASGGAVHSTEDGCFAKTFSLDPKYEPTIYHALTSPGSWLENVSVDLIFALPGGLRRGCPWWRNAAAP